MVSAFLAFSMVLIELGALIRNHCQQFLCLPYKPGRHRVIYLIPLYTLYKISFTLIILLKEHHGYNKRKHLAAPMYYLH